MFKVIALVCVMGGGCILMEESNNNVYPTLQECEKVAQEKHEIIIDSLQENNIPLEHLEVHCETTNEQM